MMKYIFLCLAAVIFICQFAGLDLGVLILHFLIINPIWSLLLGIWSGAKCRARCYIPFIYAVSYLLLSWIFLEWGESAFIMYALIYLALGLISMSVTALIKNMYKQKKERDNI